MKILFAGTPEFAKEILTTLHQHHEVLGVFCQPDRPKGRGRVLSSCPVKDYALSQNLVVFQPEKMGSNEQIQIQQSGAEIMIVVAYGQILPNIILKTPKLGCLNIHASLLPRWRGAAPIVRAIEAGDKKTGICIMQMDVGLDTGDVLLSEMCVIEPTDNAQILHDKLIKLAKQSIIKTIDNIKTLNPKKQDEQGVTYAHKLSKQEAKINWLQSAQEIQQKICAFNPYPMAQMQVDLVQKNTNKKLENQILRIISSSLITENNQLDFHQDKTSLIIQTKKGQISLENVQLQGKKVVDIQSFNNGYKLTKIL